MIVGVLVGLAGLWGVLLFAYRRPLLACWREPVLRYPILILESDDWGAGPLAQAPALDRLRSLLVRHRDQGGQPALVTLGVVLEVADTTAMAQAPGCYIGLDLRAPAYAELRGGLAKGEKDGVFALQLHGQCHYWPSNLMAASTRPEVAAWLQRPPHPCTEDLPPWLQSRWTDASQLPSRDHPAGAVADAVAAEVALYVAVFGRVPAVAVPPTFVWNDVVEAAWARAGVRCVVTPGRRYTRREANGAPGGIDKMMGNGQRTRGGMVYVVRDSYFEPALGHTPQVLVDELWRKWGTRRPCLVEMHRFNFLDEATLDGRLRIVDEALEEAQRALPTLRFMSTEALASALATRDPAWVETDLLARLRAWFRRMREISRFRRLCRLSGLALPFALAERLL